MSIIIFFVIGVFSGIDDDIQCGETSVNDNYRLKLYSNEPKPGKQPSYTFIVNVSF